MDIIILGLLVLRSMTIYDINNNFKKGLSGIYAASYGSIQNSIKKLLKNEEIVFFETVENGRNKKIYSLTDKGMARFMEFMHGPVVEKNLETQVLTKVYFLGLIESPEDQKCIVSNMIEMTTEIEAGLKSYHDSLQELNLSPAETKIAKFQFKTLEYGYKSHSFARNWLNELYESI